MNIPKLIRQFEAATLPKRNWNHFTHLQIALWYCFHEETIHDAIIKIRCGLIRYGALRKPGIICTKRYHETITVFYVFQISEFIKTNSEKSYKELESLLTESALASKEHIEKFYSKEILDSSQARAIYIAPST